MAVILSTGAINFLTGQGSYRKMLEDCVLGIFSGTPPANADAAFGGNLLCVATLASGSVAGGAYIDGTAPSPYSLPGTWIVTKAAGYTANDTVKLTVTVDGNGGVTTTITALAGDASSVSENNFCIKIWRELNRLIPQLHTIWGGPSSTVFWLQCKIAGLAMTVADGSGTHAMVVTGSGPIVTASRVNTLYFGPPTAGLITKMTGVWSGLNLASGIAGYFRFYHPSDANALDSVAAYNRVQGAISTSGAEGILTNTTITAGATTTIDNATIDLPINQ